MAKHARVEVDTVHEANRLAGYLEARGLKTRVEAPLVGDAAVLVSKPLFKGGDAFLTSLTQMIDGWLMDGFADRAIVSWQNETHELGAVETRELDSVV